MLRNLLDLSATSAVILILGSLSAHATDPTAPNSDSEQQGSPALAYTASEAERGRTAFKRNCAACHGAGADGGAFAGSLKGDKFREAFDGKPAKALFDFVSSKMPPADPGGLPKKVYLDILAFVLQVNGVTSSSTEVTPDSAKLGNLFIRLPQVE
jgi:cytochrome c5